MANGKKTGMNLPNKLTVLRICMVPVFIVVMMLPASVLDPIISGLFGVALFIAASVTDMLDGKIARKFNMISNLGKILDPMADKATQLALIICLLTTYPQLLFMMILFLVKEFFQLFAFVFNLRKGKVLDGALFIGKVCTTVLFVTLTVMILLPNLSTTVSGILIGINCFFLLIALIEYVRAFFGKHKKVKDFEQET